MPEDKSLSIPINMKTIGLFLTIGGLLAGIIGTWYLNNDRLDRLEKQLGNREQILKELKTSIETDVKKVDSEAKERDSKMSADHKENIENLNSKMEQIEDAVHGTQLTVGTIAQDIKNVSSNISEIKDDLKSIRRKVR